MTKSRQRKAKKHVLLFVVVVYFSVAVNSQWGSSALPRFKHLDFNAAKVLETRQGAQAGPVWGAAGVI